jgi:DNA-binding response OmpR family regulator
MRQTKNHLKVVRTQEPSAELIMVIDQTEEILELFNQILDAEGYRVSLHYLNERSLQEVKEIKPDLIICDHSFDDEQLAWQFLQKVRVDKQTQKIPVIVCSTNQTIWQDYEGRLFNMGIRVLSKPFQIDELLALVRELLNQTTSSLKLSTDKNSRPAQYSNTGKYSNSRG